MTNPYALNRRLFFGKSSTAIGAAALSGLLQRDGFAESAGNGIHFPAKAKRIIYLFQSGGPAQQDLFDYKPNLNKLNGEQLPDSVRGERLVCAG